MLDVIIRATSHLLVPMFAVGMVGATIVVAVTFSHDLVDFFEEDEERPSSSTSVQRS